MKQIRFNSITASAQGISAVDKNGKVIVERYDKTYQSQSNYKPKHVQKTADRIHLNFVQREMYRRLMYGLNEYSPEQIAALSHVSISRIVNDYNKASRALHIMKAKKLYKNETNLVNSIFSHVNIGEKEFDWLIELPKNATLKKLNISTRDVINEFIKRKLLPKNFYQLSPESIVL
jgi:hypothetical protein